MNNREIYQQGYADGYNSACKHIGKEMCNEPIKKLANLKERKYFIEKFMEELPRRHCFFMRFENDSGHLVDRMMEEEFIEQAITAYLDKLKAELKELGYEE